MNFKNAFLPKNIENKRLYLNMWMLADIDNLDIKQQLNFKRLPMSN